MEVGVRPPLRTSSQSHLSVWVRFLRQRKRADSSHWWMAPEQGLSCTRLPALVLPLWVRLSVYVFVCVCLQMCRCTNPYRRGCLFLGSLVIPRLEGFSEVVSEKCTSADIGQLGVERLKLCESSRNPRHTLPPARELTDFRRLCALCWTPNWPIYRHL